MGLNNIKIYLKIARSFIIDKYYTLKWIFHKDKKLNTKQLHKNKIVVSLTSFPGRIQLVHKTIRTIFMQKIKPDEVELWLAKEQFLEKEDDLPKQLIELKQYGLKIQWCENIRSYKKLVPALKMHANDIIVTIDDDVYYNRHWLAELYSSYIQFPDSISCHKVTKFMLNQEGEFETIDGGNDYYHYPSYLNKLVGVGGVLYPPNSLYEDVINEKLFIEMAPTNDDIWFWFMAIKRNKKICVVKRPTPKPIEVYGSYNTEKLSDINDNGEMLFWKQFYRLISYYPEIRDALVNEFRDNSLELL